MNDSHLWVRTLCDEIEELGAYRNELVMWLRWCDEHNHDPLYGITRPLVELWMRWLREDRHDSASTINHRVGTLGQLFDLRPLNRTLAGAQ